MLFALCLFSAAAPFAHGEAVKNKTCELSITARGGRAVTLSVEIADTWKSRQTGLMFRKSLEKNRGMLFVFNDETVRSFWMKNTYIPLSIAYIDKRGVIKEIHDMKPLDTSVFYPSRNPAKYALEVNRGWFKENNIGVGCKLNINGCLGK